MTTVQEMPSEIARQETFPPLEAIIDLRGVHSEMAAFEEVSPLVDRGETVNDLVMVGAVSGRDHLPERTGIERIRQEHPDRTARGANAGELASATFHVEEVLQVAEASDGVELTIREGQPFPLSEDEPRGWDLSARFAEGRFRKLQPTQSSRRRTDTQLPQKVAASTTDVDNPTDIGRENLRGHPAVESIGVSQHGASVLRVVGGADFGQCGGGVLDHAGHYSASPRARGQSGGKRPASRQTRQKSRLTVSVRAGTVGPLGFGS